MTRSKRMTPVKQLADDRAEAAAKRYAELRQRHEEALARLEQLSGFLADYQRQRISSGENGMDGFRLRDYLAFIGRIEAAISQQKQTVEKAQADAEQARQAWLEELGRAKALEKVVDRYRSEEQRQQERKAQRDNDELAVIMHRPVTDLLG